MMSSKSSWLKCVTIFGIIQSSLSASPRLYCTTNSSLDTYKEVPVSVMESLMDYECYNSSKPNFIWISGFTDTATSTTSIQVLEAVSSLAQGYNLFLFNWEKEASNILQTSTALDNSTLLVSYFKAVWLAFEVAKELGKALVRMAKLGFSLDNTHIVGHSLGAHLAGQAGRTVNETDGYQVGWIMGLDPAGPMFYLDTLGFPSLHASDANAVQCLHTDPGRYGTNRTLCGIDTLVNFEPFTHLLLTERVQPGCSADVSSLLSDEGGCSHMRAVLLFVEEVKSASSLTASKASDVWAWSRGQGNCSDTVSIDMEWDTTKSGLYFMSTNSSSPYGFREAGACPSS